MFFQRQQSSVSCDIIVAWHHVTKPPVVFAVCSCHWCVPKELQFDGASFKAVVTGKAQFCLSLGGQGLRIHWACSVGPGIWGPGSPSRHSFSISQQDQHQFRQFCDNHQNLHFAKDRGWRRELLEERSGVRDSESMLAFYFLPVTPVSIAIIIEWIECI